MHSGRNCHGHIWLLSGTGEGPYLAKALIEDGWKVTISVVSYQASLPYQDIPLEELHIGALDGIRGIIEFIKKSELFHGGFDWVIDATHPFAELISYSLKNACAEASKPLLRYERLLEDCSPAVLIKSYNDLASLNLERHSMLMAIGSRHLKDATLAAQQSGCDVFARVLPNQESLRTALSVLPSNHLAVVRPNTGKNPGDFELALCKQWAITDIVCRQSGGVTEKLWREIAMKRKLDLWLISRPVYKDGVETINNLEQLQSRLKKVVTGNKYQK